MRDCSARTTWICFAPHCSPKSSSEKKLYKNCQEINLIEFKVHARAIYDPLLFESLRLMLCDASDASQAFSIMHQVHLRAIENFLLVTWTLIT